MKIHCSWQTHPTVYWGRRWRIPNISPSFLPPHSLVCESLGDREAWPRRHLMGGVILPNHTSGMLRHPKQNVCGEGRQGNHTLSQPPCLLRENKEGPLESILLSQSLPLPSWNLIQRVRNARGNVVLGVRTFILLRFFSENSSGNSRARGALNAVVCATWARKCWLFL